MNEQTEKLRQTFYKIVLGNKFSWELADALVKACKEAGLRFVEKPRAIEGRATVYPKIEEIDED